MIVKSKKDLKSLEAHDWSQGVQFLVDAESGILGPNDHRDVENYPRIDSKVTDIMASIKASRTTEDIESGLWWNQEFAIFGVPDVDGIEFNDEGYVTAFPQTKHIEDKFPLRRVSGHHRGWAADDLKFRFHAGTVRIIDSDTRYRMMANENLDTYSAHPLAQMETIKQGSLILFGYASEYEEWSDVDAAHPGVFKNEVAWKNVVVQGVGKATLLYYLGKPWTITAISYLLRMIKNVERGVFSTKEVAKLPSISVANAVGTLMTSLQNEKMWPQAYKDETARGCLDAVCDPNSIATVKVISDARDFMLNQNVDPVKYLKTKTQVPFDLNGKLKATIKAGASAAAEAGEAYDSASLLEQGFMGFEKEIVQAVKELKGGTPPTSSGASPETAEAAVDAGAAAAADAAMSDVPDIPDETAMASATAEVPENADIGDMDVVATVKQFINSAYDLEMLAGRLMDENIDYAIEENAPLVKAIQTLVPALFEYANKAVPSLFDK